MNTTDLLKQMASESADEAIRSANEYAAHIVKLFGMPSTPETFKTLLVLAYNMGASQQILRDAGVLAALSNISLLNRQGG